MDYQKTKNAKTDRPKWGEVEKNENLGPCTKLNQKFVVKSSGWPHQNVSICFYFENKNYFKLKISTNNYNNLF